MSHFDEMSFLYVLKVSMETMTAERAQMTPYSLFELQERMWSYIATRFHPI